VLCIHHGPTTLLQVEHNGLVSYFNPPPSQYIHHIFVQEQEVFYLPVIDYLPLKLVEK
jgi:hypothetical protein